MRRTSALIAAAAVIIGTLTACTSPTPPAPTASTAPLDTVAPVSSPPVSSPTAPPSSSAPAATGTPAGDSSDATCASLLDPATKKALDAKGYRSFDPEKQIVGSHDPFVHFVEYGGILCEYGIPDSDGVVFYGYGPLTRAQAAEQQKALKGRATSTGKNDHGGTYYILGSLDGGPAKQVYVFSPKGYWAYSSNDIIDIQELVPNAPVFY